MYNMQDKETAQVSINGWTDKKAVAYIYNRVLFSHKKNEVLPFATTWMNLDSIKLS